MFACHIINNKPDVDVNAWSTLMWTNPAIHAHYADTIEALTSTRLHRLMWTNPIRGPSHAMGLTHRHLNCAS